jgi:F-type H+-transporting ATPase subunit c
MKRFTAMCAVLALFLFSASPSMAYVQKNTDDKGKVTEVAGPDSAVLSGSGVGAGLGAAIAIVGAGLGFGWIGSSALASIARQPERAAQIQTAMIIIAALLEGATFFALLICLLVRGTANF